MSPPDTYSYGSPPRRRSGPSSWSVIALFGLVLLLAARLWLLERGPNRVQAEPRTVTPRGDLGSGERATMDLFRGVSPSVVHITTLARRADVFSFNVLEIPQGTGSGFVWDELGHVVTNFHVISQADSTEVTLSDHTTWPARIIGVAPDKDLAVLQIEAPRDTLRPIQVGTSADLGVGQNVFAIGNPFGLDQTLTTGIISALGREITSLTRRTIKDAIQTDAAINPGNSGGPLLDSAGRLIGVNTAIFSPSGAYAGIGFAIPVDTVNWVVPELITHGKITRAGIGVQVANDALARELGLKGVLIIDVPAGGAAEQAGLRPTRRGPNGRVQLGDVITRVGGHEVVTFNDLLNALDEFKVGETITITVLRNSQLLDLSVTLEEIE